MSTILVDKLYKVLKIEGKGGWTYVELPEIKPSNNAPFGWIMVKGCIDNYHFHHYNLMPLGNGNLFLPLNATVRKSIKKQAGDCVHVTLQLDNDEIPIPNDLQLCFDEMPAHYSKFNKLLASEKLKWIKKINAKKTMSGKENIILQLISFLDNYTFF